MPQREGKGKREISPTPPYREKGKPRENNNNNNCACARISETFPPSIEMVYAVCEAEKIPRLYGDYFVDCQEKENWRHPASGKTMTSWRRALLTWWNREGTFPGRSSWEDYQAEHTQEERHERRFNIFEEATK